MGYDKWLDQSRIFKNLIFFLFKARFWIFKLEKFSKIVKKFVCCNGNANIESLNMRLIKFEPDKKKKKTFSIDLLYIVKPRLGRP